MKTPRSGGENGPKRTVGSMSEGATATLYADQSNRGRKNGPRNIMSGKTAFRKVLEVAITIDH